MNHYTDEAQPGGLIGWKHILLMILLGIILILLTITFGVGWDCILHGVNCPPPTNCTGCV